MIDKTSLALSLSPAKLFPSTHSMTYSVLLLFSKMWHCSDLGAFKCQLHLIYIPCFPPPGLLLGCDHEQYQSEIRKDGLACNVQNSVMSICICFPLCTPGSGEQVGRAALPAAVEEEGVGCLALAYPKRLEGEGRAGMPRSCGGGLSAALCWLWV